jgi:hypothetical protein
VGCYPQAPGRVVGEGSGRICASPVPVCRRRRDYSSTSDPRAALFSIKLGFRSVTCLAYPIDVAPVPSPLSPALLAACTGHSSSRLSAVSVVSWRRDCCTGWFPPDVLPTIRPLARALNAHSSPARRLHPPTSSWVDLLPGSLDLAAHAPCHTALFTCTWCTPGPVTVISRNRP